MQSGLSPSSCEGLEIWKFPFVMAVFFTKGAALALVLFVLSQGRGRHKAHHGLLL